METSWMYTLLSLFLLLLAFKFSTKSKQKLPPSPSFALPLLGHLYLLKPPLHRTFRTLSEKLGPIFSLHFGNRLMVVVSSHDLVEECFTKNDIILANRPRFIIGKYIGSNHTSLVLAPYGHHWRNLRRLTTIEVFSSTRLNSFTSIRHDETRLQLQKLYTSSKHDFVRVEPRKTLFELTFNNITRMVAGKRYYGENEINMEAKEFQETIDGMLKATSATYLGDISPIFRWIDYNGYEKNLARLSEKLDLFLQRLIDEGRGNSNSNINNNNSTMIDHLISLQESEPEYYSDMIIKGIIMVMLLVGTDTTIVTIEWAMSALLNNPKKLEKARAEIDNVVGNDRLIAESDVGKLPYLQNIVSETYRLFPAAPTLVPHESSADCKIGGYDIPRGTILLVNAWAVHRDPMIWADPTSFMPERFESGDMAHSKLITFGMGRRSCPGNGLAQRVITLALGSLIQCFEWQRVSEDMIDMSEGNKGVAVMPKAIPLEAKCKARHVLHKAVQSL